MKKSAEPVVVRLETRQKNSTHNAHCSECRSSSILYQGGKTKPVPMFVLKKRVTIPAKRYLSLSLEQSQQAVFEELKNALGKLAEG